MVKGKEQSVQFDLIGTYWGMDKNAVYIGASTGAPKKGGQAEKVIFGGSTNDKAGKAYIDLKDGKVYTKGFVTTTSEETEDESEDLLQAQSLLQISSSTDDKDVREIDVGRSTKMLHRTVRKQAATIAMLQQQLK